MMTTSSTSIMVLYGGYLFRYNMEVGNHDLPYHI